MVRTLIIKKTMTEKRLKIPKVYTFRMPNFSEKRDHGIFVKVQPELNRLLEETAKLFGKKNELINHFIWEGIKQCGGRITEIRNDNGWGDKIIGYELTFHKSYKKKNWRKYANH